VLTGVTQPGGAYIIFPANCGFSCKIDFVADGCRVAENTIDDEECIRING